jgi:hypothetical protein
MNFTHTTIVEYLSSWIEGENYQFGQKGIEVEEDDTHKEETIDEEAAGYYRPEVEAAECCSNAACNQKRRDTRDEVSKPGQHQREVDYSRPKGKFAELLCAVEHPFVIGLIGWIHFFVYNLKDFISKSISQSQSK